MRYRNVARRHNGRSFRTQLHSRSRFLQMRAQSNRYSVRYSPYGKNPEKCVEIFGPRKGERMSFHPSASSEPRKVIDKIHACGAKAFVAIEPPVPLSVLNSFAGIIDGVVIMTVNPSFARQKLIPETLDKVAECREKFAAAGRDIEIEVDGNVSFENAPKMRAADADIFVCGTSSVFSKSDSIEANTERMRTLIK